MVQPTIYKPSVYNGNGIYKNGAGGGGGGGIVLPDNIKLLSALQYDNNSNTDGMSVNVNISNEDIFEFILIPTFGTNLQTIFSRYFEVENDNRTFEFTTTTGYPGNITINYYNGGLYKSQSISSSVTQYGMLLRLEKDKLIVNGLSYAMANSFTQRNVVLKKIWARTGYGVSTHPFIRFTIYDKDENKKFDFLPAKNTDENKVGVYELINGVFTPTTNFKAMSDIIG